MTKIKTIFFTILCAFSLNFTCFAYEVEVLGDCVGVKVYTDGLMVTGNTVLEDVNGKRIDIAAGYGIRNGDIIKTANNKILRCVEDLSEIVKANNTVTLTLIRNGKEKVITVSPILTDNGRKLGLYLRDSTAGMGTLTCIADGKFYALGHGICDIDTGEIMPVGYGIIESCRDFEITRGDTGTPGAIRGEICGKKLGEITGNTHFGLVGMPDSTLKGQIMTVASPDDVETGDAVILSNVDGKGIREYSVKIKNTALPSDDGRDMIIKITDDELLNKTGGIIRGMSGSPIIQNGKLVGAVTHVFVNDPTRGYGIFIENMLAEAEKC